MVDTFPLNYFNWRERYDYYSNAYSGAGSSAASVTVPANRGPATHPLEFSNSGVSLDGFLEKYDRGGIVSYAPSGKEFEGKIVRFVDYGFPDWLRGLAWMIDDAGRQVADVSKHQGTTEQGNIDVVETVYHEAGKDGHLGNGGGNESYTWTVNYKRAHMD